MKGLKVGSLVFTWCLQPIPEQKFELQNKPFTSVRSTKAEDGNHQGGKETISIY